MGSTCRAPGCGASVTSRYSVHCNRHKAQLRRHGAVNQTAITKAELRPYLKIVRERVEKNSGSTIWGFLDARWEEIVTDARNELTQRLRIKPRQEAASEILKLADHVPARAVIETSLAMFAFAHFQPRRFKSDQAFRAQLVRRVRGLTVLNAGHYPDFKTGKRKRVYRELPPTVGNIIARWLTTAFGPTGLRIGQLIDEDGAAKVAAKAEFDAALMALQ